MTSIEHDNDAGLAGFTAAWETEIDRQLRANHGWVVLGLTNFHERPITSTRLAEVLGLSVSEAEALARQYSWPGTRTRAGDGLITVDPERAKSAARRQVQIGDRRFGVTGCGSDIFLYAPLVRPSLQVEETCPATGTPIRIVFTPSGVESVDPAGAVVPILPPREFDRLAGMTVEDIDASMCAQCPFYSSAEAAQGWLDAHPGGRVFPVRQAWELSFHRAWRDRMSALLNLGN